MKNILRNIALIFLFTALFVPATAFAKGPTVIKTLPYTISVPGNYTLSKSLTYTADLMDAITISASNVTLDLNGFGITGPGKAVSHYGGITITGNSVEVRNGYMTGFLYGLCSYYSNSIGIKASNLTTYENYTGIYITSPGAEVRDCISYNNSNMGIFIFEDGNIVTGNIAYNNVNTGIYVSEHSSVVGNNSYGNPGTGMYAGPGCTVKNNSSCGNGNYGIRTTGTVLLDGNAATGNNGGGVGANYSVAGATLGTNTP